MPKPIYAIGTKLNQNGTLEILKAGLTSDVRDAIAAEVFSNENAKTMWLGINPTFDLTTQAADELAHLAEDPTKLGKIATSGERQISFEDKSSLNIGPANDLNPLRKDPSVIPQGCYCYHGTRPAEPGEPTETPEGLPIRYLRMCPYMSSREFNEVRISWCNYLDKGSIDGSTRDASNPERSEALYEEEHHKLVAHFGSEEALNEATPLFLLWDSCKECGINDSDEE